MTTPNAWQIIDTLLNAPINSGTYRMILSGKPGIGKTVTPLKTMRDNGLTVFMTTITEETPESELRGHFIMKQNDCVWMDGPLVSAWRASAHGPVAVIINEIDKAAGEVFTLLHSVLDDHDPRFGAAQILLPTGEIVRPTPWNIRYIATMNGKYEDLPAPIQSRLPVNIEVNELHPDALRMLPDDLRALAKNMIETNNSDRQMSAREFFAFAELRKTIDPSIAAAAIFGASAKDIVSSAAAATLAVDDSVRI